MVESIGPHVIISSSDPISPSTPLPDALLLESLAPLVLLLFAELGASVYQRRSPGKKSAHVFSLFMYALFFVLPVISRKVCQSFRCNEYDAGEDGSHFFLVADTSMDCTSDRYWFMFVYACAMLLICKSIGDCVNVCAPVWTLDT